MLSRSIAITATAVLAALTVSFDAFAGEGPKGGGSTECSVFTCQVEADAPGQDGGRAGGDGTVQAGGGGTSDSGDNSSKKVCRYKRADPQPPAGSLDWEGHKPGDGAVYEQECGWDDFTDTIVRMVWLADPPEQEAIDPAVLAQRAVDKMPLLGPDIASPRAAGKYTVGVPMWMWVNQSATTYGPQSASASAGGVTVTATAEVSKIVWQMGDGVTVTCHGPGTVYRSSVGMSESPTCGHVYTEPSVSGRGGKYRVTAISTWTIDWQVTAGGGGQTGQLTQTQQSQMQVAVGEVQVVR
jgi:hypothetical protein